MNKLKNKRKLRHRRARAKIFGTAHRPRRSVSRSTKHIFLQLIDDEKGKTILGISDKEIKLKKKISKADKSFEAGKLLAERALGKKIKSAVFDRGGFRYHGRVRRVAEGAREGGLKL